MGGQLGMEGPRGRWRRVEGEGRTRGGGGGSNFVKIAEFKQLEPVRGGRPFLSAETAPR